jgi:hypothetical protein
MSGESTPDPAATADRIRFPFSRSWMVRRLWLLAAVNALLIGASWLFTLYYRVTLSSDWSAGSWVKYLFVQFHMAAENVLVTWYSSMILLSASVVSLFCHAADRIHGAPKGVMRVGWLLLSVILLLLSADEIGSIHERIGMLPILNFSGSGALGWSTVLAIPIGVVALFIVVFALTRVRRFPWALGFMILAAVLYVINPLLEKTQISLLAVSPSKDAWFPHDFSLHLEEGAELYGGLCFLIASSLYLLGSMAGTRTLDLPKAWIDRCLAVLITAMVLTWFLIQLSGFSFIKADDGMPENWYPSALCMLLAFVSSLMWHSIDPERREEDRHLARLPAFFLLLSFYYGVWIKGWLDADAIEWTYAPFLVSAFLFGIAWRMTAYLWPRIEFLPGLVGLGVWLPLLGAGLAFGPNYAVDIVEVAAFAILLIVMLQQIVIWQRSRSGARQGSAASPRYDLADGPWIRSGNGRPDAAAAGHGGWRAWRLHWRGTPPVRGDGS